MRIEEIRKKGEASFTYKLFDRYPDKASEEEKPEYSRRWEEREIKYMMRTKPAAPGTGKI